MTQVSLLRVARAALWLGILWNFACWGWALWDLLEHRHTLDVLGDSIPIALLGGAGFCVGILTYWALGAFANRRVSPSTASITETVTTRK